MAAVGMGDGGLPLSRREADRLAVWGYYASGNTNEAAESRCRSRTTGRPTAGRRRCAPRGCWRATARRWTSRRGGARRTCGCGRRTTRTAWAATVRAATGWALIGGLAGAGETARLRHLAGVLSRVRRRDVHRAPRRRRRPRAARGEPRLARHRPGRRQRDDGPGRGGVRRAADLSEAGAGGRCRRPGPGLHESARPVRTFGRIAHRGTGGQRRDVQRRSTP